MDMNQDVLEGKWKKARGAVRQRSGRLRRNYREQVMGHLQRIAGVLQERRGIVFRRVQKARRHLEAEPRS